MSEVNIDVDLVRHGGGDLSRADEKLVEMSNGCICCTLRDDLLQEVGLLAREGRFDYLLIESTGISEPLPIAATFEFRDQGSHRLSDVARLDTMVTVVDAINLLKDYASSDFLRDRGETAGDGDERALVDLLVEQIEFADVVILNKIDTASSEQVMAARQIIRSLNPGAEVIECSQSRVALDRVLDTGRFDFERAHEHPLWFKALHGHADHVPEATEYGIHSFVYRAGRPFLPETFARFIERSWPGLVRAKGYFWLATRPGWVGELSIAGALARHQAAERWWVNVSHEQWPDNTEWRTMISKQWDEVYGDRRQELVFIGVNLDEVPIREALDACLAPAETGNVFRAQRYARLPDPFPAWRTEPAFAH